MAITLVGTGTKANGTGAITPVLPGSLQAGDLILLGLETANQAITASGYTDAHTPQGQGTAAAIGAVRCTVLYRFYQPGDGNPTTSDSGNHQIGNIVAFRGVDQTTPFLDTDGVSNAASNIQSMPGLTSAVDGAVAVYFVADDRDIGSDNTQWRAAEWRATGVTSGFMAQLFDNFTSDGVGGGIAAAYGDVPSATTLTSVSAQHTGGNTFASSIIGLMLNPAATAPLADPDDAIHSHSATSPTLATNSSVAPADTAHGHSATSPSITPAGAASLSVESAAHGHSSTQPTIATSNQVAPAAATHAHTAASPTVTTANSVVPQNSVHGHSSTSPAIAAKSSIVPAAAVHGHSATSSAVSAGGSVVPASAVHDQVATSPAIAAKSSITVQPATHGHSSTSPVIAAKSGVAPDPAAHVQTATQPAISAKSNIVADSASHGHAATSPEIAVAGLISVGSATHGHAATSPSIAVRYTISANPSSHGHVASSPTIGAGSGIGVAPTLHTHTATSAVLGTYAPIAPFGAVHGHTASSPSVNVTVDFRLGRFRVLQMGGSRKLEMGPGSRRIEFGGKPRVMLVT